jgi:putative FmdB family regulatory protein
MPIYAYKCESCGAAKDVLQKISDPTLTDCPACGKPTFRKQVTAAGFQLKGSGWYATDFRGGSTGSAGSAGSTEASSGSSDSGSSGETASASAGAHGCSSDCSCG